MFSVTPFLKSTNPTFGGEAVPYNPGEGFAGATRDNVAQASVDGPGPSAVDPKPGQSNIEQFVASQAGIPAQGPQQTSFNPFGGNYLGNQNEINAQTNPTAFVPPTNQPARNAFADPGFDNYPGYNQSQYANMATANNLAQQLGGSVNQTRNAFGSPTGPPPQNMIDFGGADMLNAGLLAERYAKYDRATADAMTRAELAQMGPRSSGMAEGEEGGQFGTRSFYQPVSGGQNFLGQGANLGSSVGSNFNIAPPARPTGFNLGGGPGSQIPNFGPQQFYGGRPPMQSPGGWASRYANYRIPYGNRRYYPGLGAAPRFQPRQSQMPFTWY